MSGFTFSVSLVPSNTPSKWVKALFLALSRVLRSLFQASVGGNFLSLR